MIHLGDITAISGYIAPPVDCVIGGSPCQDLSIAGKRAGLAGARSGLFMEQIRLIKELRNADIQRGRTGQFIRPRFMLWENVPGAFSSNKGEDFRAVLEETIRIAEPDAPDIPLPKKGRWPLADAWIGDGWSVAYRVFDGQFWGVPQRRRRIALVADFGGHAAVEILFIRKSVSGDFDESQAPRETAPGGPGGGAYPTIARALTARYDGSPCLDRGPNIVCAGFRHKVGAKAGNIGFEAERTPTLLAGQIDAVYDARGNGDGKTVCTLTGDHESRVTDYSAIVMRKTKFGEYREGIGTLTSGKGHEYTENIVVSGVDCRNGTENKELSATLQSGGHGTSVNAINPIRIEKSVRRLTPLEYERLQGYPDGWTDIGPWVDSKGRRRECTDAARYKALGNSIALPPWAWVLKRLCSCYERPATMASLFDGIGGFPLIWERLNGPGSCIWASGIEDFPIAVTKYRFGEREAEA